MYDQRKQAKAVLTKPTLLKSVLNIFQVEHVLSSSSPTAFGGIGMLFPE